MNQTTSHAPKRIQNSNEYATILVRVGKESWVIGDPYPDTESESAGSESRVHQENRYNGRSVRRFGRVFDRLQSGWQGLRQSMERLADVEGQPSFTYAARRTRTARSSRGFRRKKFAQVKRKVRDSFQVGLIAGLALGCLSIVMFHQVEPSNVSSTPAAPAVTVDSSNRVMLPAVHLEALEVGEPNLSMGAAQDLSRQLEKAHIPSVLWRSSDGASVIAGVAMRGSDLDKIRKRAASTGVGVHLIAIHRNAATMTVGASLHAADTASIEHWLSAASSALNAMIAVSADGGNRRDAGAAFQAADHLRPSRDILKQSGYGPALLQFEQDMSNASAAIQKNRYADANLDSVKAAAVMSQLWAAAVGS